MDNLFELRTPNPDPLFETLALTDSPDARLAREILAVMWAEYEPYADPNFVSLLQESYYSRLWEMYLTYALLRRGVSVVPKATSVGPDIHVQEDHTDTYVEAVCPENSDPSSPDYVTELSPVYFQEISSEKYELRLQSAIESKYKTYLRYVKSGYVKTDAPYVVAINFCKVPGSNFTFGDYPWILKAVLPIGPELATIDRSAPDLDIQYSRQFRVENINRNRSPVPKTYFFNADYSEISGIMYATSFASDISAVGDDIFLIRNPFAKNKLETSFGLREITIHLAEDSIIFGQCEP